MTERTDSPTLTDRAAATRRERLEREAEALRANLRRRKQQSRARSTPVPDTDKSDRRDISCNER